MEVSQVGQTDKCVFAVVFLSCGAEHNHGHLPHPAPFVRCELEFSLGAHFGEGEHLQRKDLASLKEYSFTQVGTIYPDFSPQTTITRITRNPANL